MIVLHAHVRNHDGIQDNIGNSQFQALAMMLHSTDSKPKGVASRLRESLPRLQHLSRSAHGSH
jgi:hypothetical protein